MNRSTLVLSAAAIDAFVGDPQGMPHPVRWIGSLLTALETLVRPVATSPATERVAGAAVTCAVVATSVIGAAVCERRPLPAAVSAAAALALRNLLDEVRFVARALQRDDVALARSALARIVGRDTSQLDEGEMARAAIETLAESLCDGVVAPAFALALGGLRGAWAYKAINTLDSMIGHHEEPYRYFGSFAARLDDVVNLVPARVAALTIVAAAAVCEGSGAQAFATLRRDGRRHRSPNAGQTEAAMAGALRVTLGGKNVYNGVARETPLLAAQYRAPCASDIGRALRVASVAALFSYALAYFAGRVAEQ